MLADLLTEPSWRRALSAEFGEPYMEEIAGLIGSERDDRSEGQLAPWRADVFRALNLVPVQCVRAVIVGQDPYPHDGNADGLAFSCRNANASPKSLGKLLAEARRDLEWSFQPSRDLTPWAEQGVLLLNAALTTVVGKIWAHGPIWRPFIEAVLKVVAADAHASAIFLWGERAQEFSSIFAGSPHRVITSDHPSASRRKGDGDGLPFKGSRPFTQANAFLRSAGPAEIDWILPRGLKRRHEVAPPRRSPARVRRSDSV